MMDKEQVAAILEEIGVLLELQGENPFKCQAYHNASRSLGQLEGSLSEVITSGKLGQIRGIGERLQDHIITLVRTGTLETLEDLRRKTPAGLFQMLRIGGLGPKRVKALYDQLGVEDLPQLKAVCEEGKVAALKGFGLKTQNKILEGIAFLNQVGERVRLDQALPVAGALMNGLASCPGIVRMELCGSLRRRKEVIRDIDVLVSSAQPEPIMARFVSLPEVVQVAAQGPTKSSVIMAGGTNLGTATMINVDLRIVTEDQFPFALHYFTGSKEHNVAVRQRAQGFGLKLNEYELAGAESGTAVTGIRTEEDLFRALKLEYIPPELREETGEIQAAAEHRLPNLVTVDDIQGVFHCHTDWSDGTATLEDMAAAARAQGLHYLGIADHSQSLTIANGLSPQRVAEQMARIDALNKKLKGFKIFKGIEADILPDGRLDYEDDVLASFDYVVASVHSHFNQSREEMTARVIRALRHPCVTMFGHPTGRLLLRREAYQIDLEAVLQAAAESGTMIEINAHPQRLDLDWIHCKRAKSLGVQVVINPDAHSPWDLMYYRYGVDVARRGWLENRDVFNTGTLAQVTKALALRIGRGKDD